MLTSCFVILTSLSIHIGNGFIFWYYFFHFCMFYIFLLIFGTSLGNRYIFLLGSSIIFVLSCGGSFESNIFHFLEFFLLLDFAAHVSRQIPFSLDNKSLASWRKCWFYVSDFWHPLLVSPLTVLFERRWFSNGEEFICLQRCFTFWLSFLSREKLP